GRGRDSRCGGWPAPTGSSRRTCLAKPDVLPGDGAPAAVPASPRRSLPQGNTMVAVVSGHALRETLASVFGGGKVGVLFLHCISLDDADSTEEAGLGSPCRLENTASRPPKTK